MARIRRTVGVRITAVSLLSVRTCIFQITLIPDIELLFKIVLELRFTYPVKLALSRSSSLCVYVNCFHCFNNKFPTLLRHYA